MREKLYETLKSCLLEALELIAKKTNNLKGDSYFWLFKYHDKYPVLTYDSKSGFPSFLLSSYGQKDYDKLLSEDEQYWKSEHLQSYRDFLLASEQLTKFYELGEFYPSWRNDNQRLRKMYNDMHTSHFILDFTESYIYRNSLEFDEQKYSNLFNLFFNGIAFPSLLIDIIIPILFIQFSEDNFQIAENIYIERMSDDIQKSRNERQSFQNSVHTSVISRATHALVLKNWTLENKGYNAIHNSLDDLKSHKDAIKIVNQFMSSLRVATPNLDSGYSQIIARPIGWEIDFNLDIIQTFVVTERAYPAYFENYGWRNVPVKIDSSDLLKVRNAFDSISKNNSLQLACTRLNKACLNKHDDDAIIDISIALESLLTGDSRTEITYRLAARAVLVNKLIPFKDYTQKQVFQLCKKIYDFRSSVVHGDTKNQNKSRVIKITPDQEITAIEISLEFLKHVIWIFINHPTLTTAQIDELLYQTPK